MLTASVVPIEKGALDGQITYAKDLAAALRSAVSKASTSGRRSPHHRNRRPRRRANTTDDDMTPSPRGRHHAGGRMSALERLARSIVGGDIADVFSSGPGTVTLVVLFVATVLAVLWRGWSSASARGAVGGPSSAGGGPAVAAGRRAAYEDKWREEEGELWRWMEERAGVDVLRAGTPGGADGARLGGEPAAGRLRKSGARGGGLDWGALDGMGEREVMEAIRVTKERLERLESVVRQRTGKADEGAPPAAEAPS
jgi:hypothetical protein